MKDAEEGSGLGTKLIYSLTEQLHGDITRIDGDGTDFRVSFSTRLA
jgi:two-component sensor histidine kinase